MFFRTCGLRAGQISGLHHPFKLVVTAHRLKFFTELCGNHPHAAMSSWRWSTGSLELFRAQSERVQAVRRGRHGFNVHLIFLCSANPSPALPPADGGAPAPSAGSAAPCSAPLLLPAAPQLEKPQLENLQLEKPQLEKPASAAAGEPARCCLNILLILLVFHF